MTGSPPTPEEAPVELSLHALEIEEIPMWQGEWQALEQRSADDSVYTAYDWVHAWAQTYRPRKLFLLRAVARTSRDTVGLGLIDVDRIRSWRFAGGELTPRRGPLCAEGYGAAVWRALADRLQRRPLSWSTLEAWEVAAESALVPGAQLSVRNTFCIPAPDSLDAYFGALGSRYRGELRRRLRVAQRAGVTAQRVPSEHMAEGIADFVRLHQLRASAKDQLHHTVDGRLGRFLADIAARDSIELYLFELRQDGMRIAIDVKFGYRGICYFYNLGWEPSVARLAPGMQLAVSGIEDAIEHEMRLIDLGPGDHRYKHELGFPAQPQNLLSAANPTPPARIAVAIGGSYRRLQERSRRAARGAR